MTQLVQMEMTEQQEQKTIYFHPIHCPKLHFLAASMKGLLLFISFILCAQLLTAQDFSIDFTQLVNKTHTERTNALFDYYSEFIQYQDSTRIFEDIALVRKLAKEHKDDDLLVEADLMEAHYYAYRYDERVKELPAKLRPLMEHAKQLGDPLWFRARIESLIGTRMMANDEYELEFRYYRKANELLHDQPNEEYPIKQICLQLQARVHLHFREHQKAMELYKMSYEANSVHSRHYYAISNLSGIAYSFREMNMLDSSNYWYQKLLDKAIETNDTIWQFVAKGNLGQNLYQVGDYQNAKPLLLTDVQGSVAIQSWSNASNALAYLGDIYLTEGNMVVAEQTLKQSAEYAHRGKEISRLAVVFPFMARMYAMQGKGDLAKAYLDSTLLMRDSLDRVFDKLLLARVDQQLELEQIAKEAAILKVERQRQMLYRNAMIVSLILVLIISVLLFNRHRMKALQAKRNAENELERATAQLQDFINTIRLQNAELETAHHELEKLKDVPTDDEQEQWLEELKSISVFTDEQWEYFQKLFEKVHAGYLKRLADRFPELSPSDTRFVALAKLGLNSKHIASVLGISVDSIRQYRWRLRKRFHISVDDDMEALIQSI